jgi:hypothetical protein
LTADAGFRGDGFFADFTGEIAGFFTEDFAGGSESDPDD